MSAISTDPRPVPIVTPDQDEARRRRRVLGGARNVAFGLLIVGILVFCLAPVVWTFLTSLKTNTQMYSSPTQYWPNPINLEHYAQIFGLQRFTKSLLNSAIVASSATAISLLVGSSCAYAIARLHFPGKSVVLAVVLAVAMFPGIAILSPLYLLFRDWGLINTRLSLILPYVTFTLPICIWTLTAFFRDLPLEVEEAARVDGCTRWQVYRQIVIPLAAPGVFTTAILIFIAGWNEYLFARTFISDQALYTAPVAVAQFEGADIAAARPWGEISAAAVATTLPLVVLVLVFQRRIISGLTAGAIKG